MTRERRLVFVTFLFLGGQLTGNEISFSYLICERFGPKNIMLEVFLD